MKLIDILRAAAIGLSVLVVIGGIAMIYGVDVFFDESASGELPEIDFENFSPESGYLSCPRYICLSGEPDIESPVFDVPVAKLRAITLEAIESLPGVTRRRVKLDLQQFEFMALTPEMRTPDVITVRFFPLSESSSTLAIYSYSPITEGNDDRNQERVERWLDRISPDSAS